MRLIFHTFVLLSMGLSPSLSEGSALDRLTDKCGEYGIDADTAYRIETLVNSAGCGVIDMVQSLLKEDEQFIGKLEQDPLLLKRTMKLHTALTTGSASSASLSATGWRALMFAAMALENTDGEDTGVEQTLDMMSWQDRRRMWSTVRRNPESLWRWIVAARLSLDHVTFQRHLRFLQKHFSSDDAPIVSLMLLKIMQVIRQNDKVLIWHWFSQAAEAWSLVSLSTKERHALRGFSTGFLTGNVMEGPMFEAIAAFVPMTVDVMDAVWGDVAKYREIELGNRYLTLFPKLMASTSLLGNGLTRLRIIQLSKGVVYEAMIAGLDNDRVLTFWRNFLASSYVVEAKKQLCKMGDESHDIEGMWFRAAGAYPQTKAYFTMLKRDEELIPLREIRDRVALRYLVRYMAPGWVRKPAYVVDELHRFLNDEAVRRFILDPLGGQGSGGAILFLDMIEREPERTAGTPGHFSWMSKSASLTNEFIEPQEVEIEIRTARYLYVLLTAYPARNDPSLIERFVRQMKQRADTFKDTDTMDDFLRDISRLGLLEQQVWRHLDELHNMPETELAEHRFTWSEKFEKWLDRADNMLDAVELVASLGTATPLIIAKQTAKRIIRMKLRRALRRTRSIFKLQRHEPPAQPLARPVHGGSKHLEKAINRTDWVSEVGLAGVMFYNQYGKGDIDVSMCSQY